jgi:tetratricopeptide (TPR) repeat protein
MKDENTMPFRFRKSIKVMPGVRMTVSKSGIGASVGGRGARYSVHSSGRRTASVGIPGTGLGYTKTTSGGAKKSAPSTAPAQEVPPAPKPGFFAPKVEKELYKAFTATDLTRIVETGTRFPEYRPVAYAVARILAVPAGMHDEARRLLSMVMQLGSDPGQHPFALKYVRDAVQVPVAPGVRALMPFGRDAVGLLLAELHQEAGDLDAAIDTVEQLEPTAPAAVSLAELYTQVGRYNEVIELTNGIKNEDDATALLCVYRGVAFREQGFYDASREAFKEALKSKSMDPEIRHLGLSERAYTYLAENKTTMARKDLERILAENASYAGVRERLQELSAVE